MTYLVEILLPETGASGDHIGSIRDELTEKFGGVTLHLNAPAEGLWQDDGDVERDRIVIVEVMTETIDEDWWTAYRKALEDRFEQEEIVVRAIAITRL